MNCENYCKKWEENEINQLVKEINNLIEVNEIANNHKRTEKGIITRIQKILDDTIYDSKILKKDEIVLKYFSNNNKNNSNTILYNSIFDNLGNFQSVSQICNKYNIIEDKAITILNNLLKKNNITDNKKLRINYLLKNTSPKENNVDTKINYKNNIDKNNIDNENDTNKLIKMLFKEIINIKMDIQDIRSRLKIITSKMNSLENKINIKTDKKKKTKLIIFEDAENNIINGKNYKKSNKELNEDKEIGEDIELDEEIEYNKKRELDDSSYELEKELEKLIH